MKSNLKDKVLAAIGEGKTTMRPRSFFALRTALLCSGGFILLIALLSVASLAAFSLHESGAWAALFFGMRGLRAFILSIPLLLLVLSVIFLVALEMLARHFAFAYRRPLLISLLGIVIVSLLGGYALARSPLHMSLRDTARQGNWPVMMGVYRNFTDAHSTHVHRGTVASSSDEGFMLMQFDGTKFSVTVSNDNGAVVESPEDGAQVIVIGEEENGGIEALGIRPLIHGMIRRPPRAQKGR